MDTSERIFLLPVLACLLARLWVNQCSIHRNGSHCADGSRNEKRNENVGMLRAAAGLLPALDVTWIAVRTEVDVENSSCCTADVDEE